VVPIMKITPDNIGAKLKKVIDIRNIKELNMANMQIDEIGSFLRLESLEKMDLSGNRIQFFRQMEKLFEAPILKEVNLSGNPVCKTANYRAFVIHHCPHLEILDEEKITESEKENAMITMTTEKTGLSRIEEARKKEEEVDKERLVRVAREKIEFEQRDKERKEKEAQEIENQKQLKKEQQEKQKEEDRLRKQKEKEEKEQRDKEEKREERNGKEGEGKIEGGSSTRASKSG